MQVIDFHYLTVQLKTENWRNYIRQDNPVAAALLSKMGYTEREKIEVKTEFLQMVLRMQLDPARLTLLMGFFDTYLQLTKEEEEKVIEEVKAMSAKEGEKVMEIISSYERRGREEGREEALLLVAKKMKEKGKTAEEIAEFTGFLKEEIEKL
ncbi:hypothetical protein [Neobacillus mesonae]|uniref:Transposase n=2 Tax=Neobacillus mesonae TaxID=1193713 RepID=A0A3T0I4X1_9BACI|nr:hypothetical protein [Neobacillus mesonae]AZU64382.1 hypothetical protein CHR53_25860 [Neobacillus mesonae]MED4203530.1 hypothetical protein [Neobacillus mesonae]